jgi:hypothetical protein
MARFELQVAQIKTPARGIGRGRRQACDFFRDLSTAHGKKEYERGNEKERQAGDARDPRALCLGSGGDGDRFAALWSHCGSSRLSKRNYHKSKRLGDGRKEFSPDS